MEAPQPDSSDVTLLLRASADGDNSARERVIEAIYQELRKVARGLMSGERPNHTLQATALVNEALMKLLAQQGPLHAENRHHLMAMAALSMRRLLVDHARTRNRARRGGGIEELPIQTGLDGVAESGERLLLVNDALDRLKAVQQRVAAVAELRIFGGFSPDEIADVLGVTRRTVERDWVFAKAFLTKLLQ